MTVASASWRTWVGFSAMAAGMFLAILDIQIVASSLVDIAVDLHIPADRLSYLQTAYLIAEVIAIALTGWLTRGLSTRGLFCAGLGGFICASAACAASTSYPALVGWRFAQGLFGGVLIPSVFSAAMLMFPLRQQGLATVIAGTFAMLAPTIGPFIGGWITETLSWHWLFLINIAPGILMAVLVAWTVRIDTPRPATLRKVDGTALVGLIAFLATLELVLKEAPHRGWASPLTLGLTAICCVSGVLTIRRCMTHADPLIDLGVLRDRSFAVGAVYSFVLGMALFGATYLMPLFLGLVRGHGPLEIGTIMMVTGAAQLVTAPAAIWIEQRVAPRALTACGYALFAGGLAANAVATPAWDFGELFPRESLSAGRKVLSVTDLTGQIRRLLEKQVGQIWVTGEVTNLRVQSSGHLYFTLKDANAHLTVYLKQDIPARFHFNANPRITPIVAIADEGWTITTRARFANADTVGDRGAHGYDNALPSMGAIFVGAGPAFRRGVTVPPFQNIHVYPLLAAILGVTPARVDGSLDSVRALLRR